MLRMSLWLLDNMLGTMDLNLTKPRVSAAASRPTSMTPREAHVTSTCMHKASHRDHILITTLLNPPAAKSFPVFTCSN